MMKSKIDEIQKKHEKEREKRRKDIIIEEESKCSHCRKKSDIIKLNMTASTCKLIEQSEEEIRKYINADELLEKRKRNKDAGIIENYGEVHEVLNFRFCSIKCLCDWMKKNKVKTKGIPCSYCGGTGFGLGIESNGVCKTCNGNKSVINKTIRKPREIFIGGDNYESER